MSDTDRQEDVDVIVPMLTERFVIEGIDVRVGRLRTREMLSLLGILTKGLGDHIGQLDFDSDDENEFGAKMIGLMLVAIPEAQDEFIDFVQRIVVPVDKSDQTKLYKLLDNPELETLMDVAERVVAQEKGELSQLVGKARAMWTRMENLFVPKGRSPEPSTSSPASTDGETTQSSISPLGDSGKSSQSSPTDEKNDSTVT